MTTEISTSPEARTEVSSDTISAESNNSIEGVLTEVPAEGPKDLISSLSEELRKEKSLHSFKDVNSLAKSYTELNKKLGKRLEDLTPDEIKSLDKRFGAPEKAEDYGIKLPDEYKNDKILSNIHNDFLDAGIPKDKANKLLSTVMNKLSEERSIAMADLKVSREKEISDLKSEFGSAFESKVNMANKALAKFGGPEVSALIRDSGLDTNPSLVKMFSAIGKLISEDNVKGGESSASFMKTPEEKRMAIAEFRRNNAEILNNYNHPDHHLFVEQLSKLYKQ